MRLGEGRRLGASGNLTAQGSADLALAPNPSEGSDGAPQQSYLNQPTELVRTASDVSGNALQNPFLAKMLMRGLSRATHAEDQYGSVTPTAESEKVPAIPEGSRGVVSRVADRVVDVFQSTPLGVRKAGALGVVALAGVTSVAGCRNAASGTAAGIGTGGQEIGAMIANGFCALGEGVVAGLVGIKTGLNAIPYFGDGGAYDGPKKVSTCVGWAGKGNGGINSSPTVQASSSEYAQLGLELRSQGLDWVHTSRGPLGDDWTARDREVGDNLQTIYIAGISYHPGRMTTQLSGKNKIFPWDYSVKLYNPRTDEFIFLGNDLTRSTIHGFTKD